MSGARDDGDRGDPQRDGQPLFEHVAGRRLDPDRQLHEEHHALSGSASRASSSLISPDSDQTSAR